MHRENLKISYWSGADCSTKLCMIKLPKSVPLQILQIFTNFRPFFLHWTNFQNCFGAVNTEILNRVIICLPFLLTQWDSLRTGNMVHCLCPRQTHIANAHFKLPRIQIYMTWFPQITCLCIFFISLLFYKHIISWKLLYVKDFGSKLA